MNSNRECNEVTGLPCITNDSNHVKIHDVLFALDLSDCQSRVYNNFLKVFFGDDLVGLAQKRSTD